jgi:hypothetical protein
VRDQGRVRRGARPFSRRAVVLKERGAPADTFAVSDRHIPPPYLNAVERRLLGALVARLCATGNPRFRAAVETTGEKATVRMACVNALRIYAVGLFVLGMIGRLAGVTPLGYLCLALAVACMAWSFWCLYTVVGPEREFKRLHAEGPRPL